MTKNSNPPPPAVSDAARVLVDALDATAELATGVPLKKPGPLPILQNHDPEALLGFVEWVDGRCIATFKPGTVTLEAMRNMGGGWRVEQYSHEGPGLDYVTRAELILFSTDPAREGQTMTKQWKAPALGDRVKDRVTGFTGIVVCTAQWLNGCDRVAVQPEKLDEGKVGEPQHFDAPQVDVIKAAAHTPYRARVEGTKAAARPGPGGPQRDIPSRRPGE